MKKRIMVIALMLVVGLALAARSPASLASPETPGGPELSLSRSEVVLEPWGGGLVPVDNPDETLRYDGGNYNGIGLTRGGTYRGAVRFTPTATCTVKAILFYQRDASHNDYVFAFAEDNDTNPGGILDSAPYTGSGGMQWKRVNLPSRPVVTAGSDFWACVRVTHDSGAFPLGTDSGPMVPNRGGFISTGAGWRTLLSAGLNYNWNVRAIVASVPGQANDVGVTRVMSPAVSVPPGTYQPKARIVNFGTTPVSNIPVTCLIDSAGQQIYSQSTNFAGPLQPGNRAEVTFPNWTTGPARNSYTIRMFTSLGGDPNPANDTTIQVTNTVAVLPFADHDTGNCRLTVTCFGAIGHDVPSDAGSGFKWPKTSADWLYFGSLAIGNAPDYVVDHYYSNPPTNPPNNDFRPVDSVTPVVPPVHADQHFRASYSDALHPTPKGIKVTQNSYATGMPWYRNSVVMVFDIENQGTSPVTGLYAGTFTDFDMGTSNQTTTVADTVRRIVVMRQSTTANPSIGVKILEPQSWRNLTSIDHNIWVYPDSCVTDNQKYRFLSGAIVNRNSNRAFDWSTVTSVGPFDLDVGETYRFAVAFCGGTSEADCRANADSVQSWYDRGMPVGLAENVAPAKPSTVVKVGPSLFRQGTFIDYVCRTAGELRVEAYDAAGRLVDQRTLAVRPGAGRYVWQPGALVAGIYFLNVRTPDSESLTKVLLVE